MTRKFSRDPVHREEEDGKWYFWDETWADRNGPFDTELIAREELKKYGEYLDHGNRLTFLCYWELHVDDMTFIVHVLVKAATEEKALEEMKPRHGEHHHLQVKGCLGEFDEDLCKKYMGLENLQSDRITYVFKCPECEHIDEVKLLPEEVTQIYVPCTMCTGLNPPVTNPINAPEPHSVLVGPKE